MSNPLVLGAAGLVLMLGAVPAGAAPAKAPAPPPPPSPPLAAQVPAGRLCRVAITRPGFERLKKTEPYASGGMALPAYEVGRELVPGEGILEVRRQYSNGQQEAQYYLGGVVLRLNVKGRPEIYRLGGESWAEDFLASPFPELDWVGPATYAGVKDPDSESACYIYETTDERHGTRRAEVSMHDLLPRKFTSPAVEITYRYPRHGKPVRLPEPLEQLYRKHAPSPPRP